MHLTSVDLPAPLSPTSAVTSPGYTERLTSRRTCTGPKLLSIPRTSKRGVAFTAFPSARSRWWCPGRNTTTARVSLLDAGRGAHGRVRSGAELRGADVTVLDHVLDVVLGD